jgi:putative DNA primase/helicase
VGRDEWFADTPIRIGEKDAMLSLAGKWLYEVGELDSFNRAEVTAVKQYVSSRIDRVREPFARRPADRPRSGVFGGTTNQAEYFKDPTGARRFWPVACDGHIDLEKLAQWREQLFAEARARLASDDFDTRRSYPTYEETEKYLRPQQELREIMDPWLERISTWVNCRTNYGESGLEVRQVESFSAFDLLTKSLNVPSDRIDGNRSMATRVGNIMHRLGWKKKRDSTGERNYRYFRPRAAQAEAQGDDKGAAGGPDAQASSEPEVLHEF